MPDTYSLGHAGRHLLIWPVIGMAAVLLSRYSNLDLWLTGLWYSPDSNGFPLRNAWLPKELLHDQLKNISSLAGILLLLVSLHAAITKHGTRARALLFTVLVAGAAAGINGWFKHVSTHSCPWSLTLFGGEADYFRMLAPLPAHPGSGGCSPSGHAGNGFMWIAAVYAAALWRPAWTRPLAVSVAVFGTLCAAAQIVRGAHFLSHVLLALALCGGVSGAAWLLVLNWRQRSAS